MSLPIVVACEPYKTDLRAVICVRRWREANGKIERTISGIKVSHCRRCPVGEAREAEAMKEGEVELICPYCKEPRKRLERLPGGFKACRKCKIKGVGGKPGTPSSAPVAGSSDAVISKAQRELSDVERFISMMEGRRRLKQKHVMENELMVKSQAEESMKADAAIAEFERSFPDVRAKAKALIDGALNG